MTGAWRSSVSSRGLSPILARKRASGGTGVRSTARVHGPSALARRRGRAGARMEGCTGAMMMSGKLVDQSGGWGTRVGGWISRTVSAVGSLRNPVGPLPSTIYWRRRVVVVPVIALLAPLVAWASSPRAAAAEAEERREAPTARAPRPRSPRALPRSGPDQPTPGRPRRVGRRWLRSTAVRTAVPARAAPTAAPVVDSGGGTGGAARAGFGSRVRARERRHGRRAGRRIQLPVCAPTMRQVSLRARRQLYGPDENPNFELVERNTSAADCKVDFGPENAVLTITQADEDDSSSGPPTTAPSAPAAWLPRFRPATTIIYTVKWDRKASAPAVRDPARGQGRAPAPTCWRRRRRASASAASFVLATD